MHGTTLHASPPPPTTQRHVDHLDVASLVHAVQQHRVDERNPVPLQRQKVQLQREGAEEEEVLRVRPHAGGYSAQRRVEGTRGVRLLHEGVVSLLGGECCDVRRVHSSSHQHHLLRHEVVTHQAVGELEDGGQVRPEQKIAVHDSKKRAGNGIPLHSALHRRQHVPNVLDARGGVARIIQTIHGIPEFGGRADIELGGQIRHEGENAVLEKAEAAKRVVLRQPVKRTLHMKRAQWSHGGGLEGEHDAEVVRPAGEVLRVGGVIEAPRLLAVHVDGVEGVVAARLERRGVLAGGEGEGVGGSGLMC